MLGRVLSRRWLMLALSLLGACSADHASEPEPTLETKGAFLAVASDDGGYELLRTLAVIGSGRDDDAFFVVPYDVTPQSFAAARELAKDPSLATKPVVAIGRRYITSRDWEVVWFRSVSAAEEREFR
jgi:hypothetical protein